MEVDIPAGVDDGLHMQVSGKGNAGVHGGPPGNLFVLLQVRARWLCVCVFVCDWVGVLVWGVGGWVGVSSTPLCA